jgi:RNA polymerase sigma-70 factor (ECF subfamily)
LEIEAAINALSEEQRTIFVLTELQGMSYREVADVIGCPVGTVASRKSAAFKALRDRLAPLQS